ncbi:MAG: efflux RND transporter periplasmic adaptor subunit [Caulobacter sp.]|nr:efflux RND transporter periplasmic adaptor subunit [Vitreoscilla sp.]
MPLTTSRTGRTPPTPTLLLCALLTTGTAHAAEFDCLIEPRRTVLISGPVEALITQVRVDRGDLVRKGDVLVEFESGVERATAELARQRSEVVSAIEARQARQEYAVAKVTRRQELTKQNFISQQDLEESEAERRLTEAELKEARDNKRLAELEYRRAAELLRQRSLTSPVSGIVVERLMHPGEVSELGKKPILKIADIDTLSVEVVLPLAAYRQVAKGDVASVRPEGPIGGQHEARVAVVDKVLDAASGTFGARLDLPNPKGAIPAGVRCRIDFPKVTAPTGTRGARPLGAATGPASPSAGR